MSEDLTTRDVFQQVDSRLTRVEDDLRHLRADMNAGFARLDLRIDQFHQELTQRMDQWQQALTRRMDEGQRDLSQRMDEGQRGLSQRMDQLQWRMVGLFIVTWITVVGSIWLKTVTNPVMSEDLTTRDVFQQVDSRLTRVEDDLRQLRADTNAGFARLDLRIDQFHQELTQRMDQWQQALIRRMDEGQRDLSQRMDEGQRDLSQRMDEGQRDLSQRMDEGQRGLSQRMDRLQWRMVGLFIVTWITVVGSIWLKP